MDLFYVTGFSLDLVVVRFTIRSTAVNEEPNGPFFFFMFFGGGVIPNASGS